MSFKKEEAQKLLEELVKNGSIVKEYIVLKEPPLKVVFKSLIASSWHKVPLTDNTGKPLDSRQVDLNIIASSVIGLGDATFNSAEEATEALSKQSQMIVNKIGLQLRDFEDSINELVFDEDIKKN